MAQNNSILGNSVIRGFLFQKNPRDLDPSFKRDLDLEDCFGRENLVLCGNQVRVY